MAIKPEKLRIMQIIPSLARGGAERLVVDICLELQQREDAEVLLVSLRPENTFALQTSQLNYIVCPNKNEITGQFDVSKLEQTVKSFRPHVIHSHLFEAEWASRQTISGTIRYFSHLHDNMPGFNRLSVKSMLSAPKAYSVRIYEKYKLLNRYRQCNNSFLAVSTDIYKHFITVLPAHFHPRIFHFPNAINFKKFNTSSGKNLNSGTTLRLVTVGSLVEKKNQSFLLPVVKRLLENAISVQLDIVGDGENRASIGNQIRAMGLQDHVFLRGERDDVEKIMKQADIYVHSATYEPFGLVFLEAMASGLPCIALDAAGNRDIIRNDFNGYLLPGKDEQEFFEKIKLVAGSPELYQQLSLNAIEFASTYDIKSYVDRLLEHYRAG